MKVKYRYAYRAHRHCEQPHHVTFGTISIPSLFFGPPPLCVPICPFRRHGWHGSGGGRKRGRGRSGGPTKIRLSERPIACRRRGKRETNNGPSRLCVCVCAWLEISVYPYLQLPQDRLHPPFFKGKRQTKLLFSSLVICRPYKSTRNPSQNLCDITISLLI